MAGAVVSFSRLMQTLFYRIPKRAVQNAIFETALYANLKTIPCWAARGFGAVRALHSKIH
jgi:hypothetical protein